METSRGKKRELKARWTSDMEARLVELWQQQECIYNVSSRNYHNRFEKEKCWSAIASALGQQVSEVKMRATSLRTQYTRLLKPQSWSGKSLTRKQRWILRSLKFLKVHVTARMTEISAKSDADKPHSDEDEGADDPDGLCDEESEMCITTLDMSPTTSMSSPPPSVQHASDNPPPGPPRHTSTHLKPGKKHKRLNRAEDLELQKLVILKQISATIQAPPSKPDAVSAFAQQVAEELRLVTDPRLQIKVKRQIMNILYEAQESVHCPRLSPQQYPPPSPNTTSACQPSPHPSCCKEEALSEGPQIKEEQQDVWTGLSPEEPQIHLFIK